MLCISYRLPKVLLGLGGCKLFFSVPNWCEDPPFLIFFFFRKLMGCWWHNLICKAVFSLSWISPDSSWQSAVRINLLNILTHTQKSWTPHGYRCLALFFARILKFYSTFPYDSLKRRHWAADWTFCTSSCEAEINHWKWNYLKKSFYYKQTQQKLSKKVTQRCTKSK